MLKWHHSKHTTVWITLAEIFFSQRDPKITHNVISGRIQSNSNLETRQFSELPAVVCHSGWCNFSSTYLSQWEFLQELFRLVCLAEGKVRGEFQVCSWILSRNQSLVGTVILGVSVQQHGVPPKIERWALVRLQTDDAIIINQMKILPFQWKFDVWQFSWIIGPIFSDLNLNLILKDSSDSALPFTCKFKAN